MMRLNEALCVTLASVLTTGDNVLYVRGLAGWWLLVARRSMALWRMMSGSTFLTSFIIRTSAIHRSISQPATLRYASMCRRSTTQGTSTLQLDTTVPLCKYI